VVILLLLTRTIPSIEYVTTHFLDFSWNNILNFSEISSAWQFLYSPGTILILSALFAILVQRNSFKNMANASKESLSTINIKGTTVVATLAMVQVFINSGIKIDDLNSMAEYIAQNLAATLGAIW